MTKREYIERLGELLSYELPERLVKKNTAYYSDYFDEQIRLGRRAEDICEELGDPQLIARSCIDAEKAGEDGIPYSGDEPDFHEEMYGNGAESENGQIYGDSESSGEDGGSRKNFRIYGREFGCGGCLIGVLIFTGIMCLVSTLFSTLFTAGGNPVITLVLFVILAIVVGEYFRRK